MYIGEDRMKKVLIGFLILVLLGSVIGMNIIKSDKAEKYDKVFLNILNGYSVIEKVDKKVLNFCNSYISNNLCSDDTLFLLLSDVEGFKGYQTDAMRLSQFFEENPFVYMEEPIYGSIEDYEKFYPYFSYDNLKKDSRVIEQNNCYYIKVGDLDFSKTNTDNVTFGHFHRYVDEKEIEKETISQRQNSNRYSSIGYLKDGNIVNYKYLDNKTNETVEIVVGFEHFYVKSCDMI